MNLQNRIKLLVVALILALGVGIYLLVPGFYAKLFSIAASGNIEEIVEFIQSFGVWAMLISFLLGVLINALSVLPTIFLSTANGLIFGLPLGITISWLGECVGVIISFYLMRLFMYDTAQKLIHKSKRLEDIDAASGREGLKFMTLARMLPYVPSGLLTAVGAVSSMSARDFIISSFIGKFPSTALETILGHDLVEFSQHAKRLGITAAVILAIYLYTIYDRNKKKKAAAENEKNNQNNK